MHKGKGKSNVLLSCIKSQLLHEKILTNVSKHKPDSPNTVL